jgi:hypothetical protein
MNVYIRWSAGFALVTLGVFSACARTAQPEAGSTVTPITGHATASMRTAATVLPLMVVHKNASCGCCGAWIQKMREAGFQVEVRNEDNLDPIKTRLGIPVGKGSCHTAEVGGYFVEGHVPAGDIKRLLAQKPNAKGLVLPGMPAGAPGMEMSGGTAQPYTVELVERDGTTTPFTGQAK